MRPRDFRDPRSLFVAFSSPSAPYSVPIPTYKVFISQLHAPTQQTNVFFTTPRRWTTLTTCSSMQNADYFSAALCAQPSQWLLDQRPGKYHCCSCLAHLLLLSCSSRTPRRTSTYEYKENVPPTCQLTVPSPPNFTVLYFVVTRLSTRDTGFCSRALAFHPGKSRFFLISPTFAPRREAARLEKYMYLHPDSGLSFIPFRLTNGDSNPFLTRRRAIGAVGWFQRRQNPFRATSLISVKRWASPPSHSRSRSLRAYVTTCTRWFGDLRCGMGMHDLCMLSRGCTLFLSLLADLLSTGSAMHKVGNSKK
ncbi:hypothetical protein ACRALDRAFT_213610 [Sodiomyces alcalophilus JCM 7366]|uniref:uncharacterized protein n=1 Tax=Sodiomyces alcalophilus JCM 7366 TaxID=591952 RepID=UPI0039B3EE20